MQSGHQPPPSTPEAAATRPPGDSEDWFMPFIPAEAHAGPPPRGYDYAAPRRVSWYVPLLGGCLTIFALIAMACAALAGVAVGFPAKSETKTQSIAVDANPTIVIKTSFAPVRVETGRDDQVLVEESKAVRDLSPGSAQRELDRMAAAVGGGGKTVTIDAADVGRSSFARDPDFPVVFRHYELVVTVPPHANLNLTGSSGSVRVEGVTGTITGQLTSGSLRLDGVTLTGDSSVRGTSGSVRIDGALATGAKLDVGLTSGSVRLALPQTTDAHLDAAATSGSIHVSDWPIPVSRSGQRVASRSTPAARSGRSDFVPPEPPEPPQPPMSAGATAAGDLSSHPTGSITIRVTSGSIMVESRDRD